MENPRHDRHSFFWPILLVGVGLVWLLVNLGIIAPISFATIIQFWPILLILLGLDILFGRRFPWVGGLAALLILCGFVAYFVMQPNTGSVLTNTGQSKEETFNAPLEETTSASYYLETSSEPVSIDALNASSDQLINADLIHQGTINFNVTGSTNKKAPSPQAPVLGCSEILRVPSDWRV